ncbi:hypothetical protein MtrunA17_Chr6g0465031 [Medicago truncatula]|uniref:Uncharacterized protein n=1 Tax=Medicago truncatula TaxID=3880 RepID=A0A396HJN9_MEDTR|nr:hypothetical protein MtrunA17_Chr6g0465031 [Medicago truncatula]
MRLYFFPRLGTLSASSAYKIISLCHSILPILLLQMPKQTLIQSNAPTHPP